MSTPKHLIGSLRFDTAADGEYSASSFADAVSAVDHERAFARVLALYDHMAAVVRLDKIELDMGYVDIEKLDDLEERLSALLAEAMAGQISALPAGPTQGAYNEAIKRPVPPERQETAMDDNASRIVLLLYYFRTGSLPWYAASNKPDIAALIQELIQTAPGLLQQQLLPELGHSDVTQRIVYALPYAISLSLLECILNHSDWTATTVISKILVAAALVPERSVVQRELLLTYLRTAGTAHRSHTPFPILMSAAMRPLIMAYAHIFTQEETDELAALAQQETTPVYQRLYDQLLLQVQEVMPWEKGEKDFTASVDDVLSAVDNASVDKDLTEAIPEKVFEKKETGEQELPQSAALFIDNAGLILIASFLPAAFRKLGWVDNGQIVNKEAGAKMLLWMDYLVWGPRKVYEYNLSLNKILAGMPLATIADCTVLLSAEEQDLADQLLANVIAHWSILKNTSPEGLRTSFLQRQGRLQEADGAWQLHVAAQAFDMLIDRLPWSFSIIKFPWMEQPIYTQWRTSI